MMGDLVLHDVEEAEADGGDEDPGNIESRLLARRGSRPGGPHANPGAAGRWLQRADTQIVVLGLVCFCCPGMYNSIVSLAGGIDDQEVASASTATLYLTFTVLSLMAPAVCNRLGPRATLFLGSLGYLTYAGTLLWYRQRGGAGGGWAVVAAGACNGAGAALLWTAQGQVMMAYPSKEAKGFYTALFWAIFNSGAVVGGAITLGVNYGGGGGDAGAAGVSSTTFVAFVAVMVLGSLLCAALVPPETVVRADGGHVQVEAMPPWTAELQGMGELLRQPRVVLLLPFFAYSNWFYTYEFGTFNAGIFNARTQGLCNMFFWGSQMVGAFAIGLYLDAGTTTGAARLRQRALRALLGVAALGAVTWAAALRVHSDRDLDHRGAARVDFTDGPAFAGACAVYAAFGLTDAFIQCWSYWIMGQMADSPAVLSRCAGVYKAVQSAGAAVAWALNGAGVLPSTQAYINVGLMVVATPLALRVAARMGSLDDRPTADRSKR